MCGVPGAILVTASCALYLIHNVIIIRHVSKSGSRVPAIPALALAELPRHDLVPLLACPAAGEEVRLRPPFSASNSGSYSSSLLPPPCTNAGAGSSQESGQQSKGKKSGRKNRKSAGKKAAHAERQGKYWNGKGGAGASWGGGPAPDPPVSGGWV